MSFEPNSTVVAKRNRLLFCAIVLFVIALGLLSRNISQSLPPLLATNAGDILWASAVYFFIAGVFSHWPPLRVAFSALLFSFAIECSQIYQADWINAIRHTRLGGLILGFDFLWTDLICYTIGVVFAGAVDFCISAFRKQPL